ncbi:MAG: hypothetical protein WCQ99_01180 [Pseudomonadota bacterium]
MPVQKTIVCLANSRKPSGHCVSGKEWGTDAQGRWIRPVSRTQSGGLSSATIMLDNGREPQPLDIITIDLQSPAPDTFQSENWLISSPAKWSWQGRCANDKLTAMCDAVPSLWTNNHSSNFGLNDKISTAYAQEKVRSSLVLIKVPRLLIRVQQEYYKIKARAVFAYNQTRYCLAVTDLKAKNYFKQQGMGEYFLERELFLCISIGVPYNGYCYKLVAGIVNF